jgi:hypothetical protein
VDVLSPSSEAVHEDEAESDVTQVVQLPSQSSQHGTAPWIVASRTPHAQKKPADPQFMAYMADIRRQNTGSDADGTGSTPRVSFIVPRFSVTSTPFSESFYVASPPPIVEFPPTPVFKDEIPEGDYAKG